MKHLHVKLLTNPSKRLRRRPRSPIPLSLFFLATRWLKLDQNLISSGCGHDTLACQISCYSFHVVSSKYPETPITLSSLATKAQNGANTDRNRIITKSGRDTPACHSSWHPFHAYSLKCLVIRGTTLSQWWPKSNHVSWWLGYISMAHYRPFLHCNFRWMPWNPNVTNFFDHQRTEIGPVPVKIDKITGGNHDTSRCHISSHFFHAVPPEC